MRVIIHADTNQEDYRMSYRRVGMGDPSIIGPTGLPITVTGSGDCVNGYDSFGNACTDFSQITSNPAATAAAIQYLYNSPSTLPVSSAPKSTVSMSSILLGLGALFAVVLLQGGRR